MNDTEKPHFSLEKDYSQKERTDVANSTGEMQTTSSSPCGNGKFSYVHAFLHRKLSTGTRVHVSQTQDRVHAK